MMKICMRLALVMGLALAPAHAEERNAQKGRKPAASSAVDVQAAMKDGVEALYDKGEPERALEIFARVLEEKPSHYGANIQLGKALRAAGRSESAQRHWAKVQQLAEAAGDRETATMAKMQRGLGFLYYSDQPKRATVMFREIQADQPSHYGANFQLARSLQRTGQDDQAIALWKTVIARAEGYGDEANERHARQALSTIEMARHMKRGMSFLYDSETNPVRAAAVFRSILDSMPTHYGANYQLAKALDAAGRSDEAQLQWAEVVEAAETIGDRETASSARMRRGVALLYGSDRPGQAAQLFRGVLADLPSHYGANYQLAVALDRTAKRDEARALWAAVLEMARGYSDENTARTAERRLSR